MNETTCAAGTPLTVTIQSNISSFTCDCSGPSLSPSRSGLINQTQSTCSFICCDWQRYHALPTLSRSEISHCQIKPIATAPCPAARSQDLAVACFCSWISGPNAHSPISIVCGFDGLRMCLNLRLFHMSSWHPNDWMSASSQTGGATFSGLLWAPKIDNYLPERGCLFDSSSRGVVHN